MLGFSRIRRPLNVSHTSCRHSGRPLIAGSVAVAIGCGLASCGGSGGSVTVANRTTGSSSSTATTIVTRTVAPTTSTSTDALAKLVATAQSGVIRIQANGCGTQDIGTGFLIGPQLVATVEHVVDGASSISLVQNGKIVGTGAVIGDDPVRDVALVQANRPLSGHVFQLESTKSALGTSVAALGFPLGLPLTVTQGGVSGLNRTIPIDGIRRRDLIQTDAAVNPGNSGGPLLSLDNGRVVGLIDLGTTQANGIAFAVSAQVAVPLLQAWTASPQSKPQQLCQQPTSTATSTTSTSSTQGGPIGAVVALDDYWNDISIGAYAAAYAYLAPGTVSQSETQFVSNEEAAAISQVQFAGELAASHGATATVTVTNLRTVDGHYGCRTWTGSYQMTYQASRWLIAQSNITPAACAG